MNTKKALWIAVGCLALVAILTASEPPIFKDRREPNVVFRLEGREVALAVLDSDGEVVADEWGKAVDDFNDRRGIPYSKRDILYFLVRSSDGWSARAIQLKANGLQEWVIPLTDPWEEPPKPEAIPWGVWVHFMNMFPDGFYYPYGDGLTLDAGTAA